MQRPPQQGRFSNPSQPFIPLQPPEFAPWSLKQIAQRRESCSNSTASTNSLGWVTQQNCWLGNLKSLHFVPHIKNLKPLHFFPWVKNLKSLHFFSPPSMLTKPQTKGDFCMGILFPVVDPPSSVLFHILSMFRCNFCC